MFVALDKNGNRVYARSTERIVECFCPACGEQLIHKIGKYKRSHFAHKVDTNCYYGKNKDNKCEWHLRMQELFPEENIEHRFVDAETGEIHIADVFIPDQNIVIEFQHSPITLEEHYSRTAFHIKNGRGIIWVFDESKDKSKDGNISRLKKDDLFGLGWPHNELNFRWLRNPRKILADSLDMKKFFNCYAIYVRTGLEGDGIRRIVSQDCDFEYITLSINLADLSKITNYKELFYDDNYWVQNNPQLYNEYIRRLQIESLRQQSLKRASSVSLKSFSYGLRNRRKRRF